jgi:hypothetical protein
MTPDEIAKIEALTENLREFAAICGRIRAEMDEIYFQALVSALADAANKQESQS